MSVQPACRMSRLFSTLAVVISILVYGTGRSASFLEMRDFLEPADAILVPGGDSQFLRTIEAVNL